MNFSLVQTAMAQTQGSPAQPTFFESMLPLIVIFFLMYLILIRPQAKKVKDQQNFISAMKPGDEVLTSSGIIGRIKSVNDQFVSVDVGCGNIKVVKEHITGPVTAPAETKK
jgi:preprotein translocase subunit YajC